MSVTASPAGGPSFLKRMRRSPSTALIVVASSCLPHSCARHRALTTPTCRKPPFASAADRGALVRHRCLWPGSAVAPDLWREADPASGAFRRPAHGAARHRRWHRHRIFRRDHRTHPDARYRYRHVLSKTAAGLCFRRNPWSRPDQRRAGTRADELAGLCAAGACGTAALRRSDYLAAAEMVGIKGFRLLWGHILPLVLPSAIIRLALDLSGIILAAADSAFLVSASARRPPNGDRWWRRVPKSSSINGGSRLHRVLQSSSPHSLSTWLPTDCAISWIRAMTEPLLYVVDLTISFLLRGRPAPRRRGHLV